MFGGAECQAREPTSAERWKNPYRDISIVLRERFFIFSSRKFCLQLRPNVFFKPREPY
jgi:hypothetical protein